MQGGAEVELPLESGPTRYQPEPDNIYAHNPALRFDQRRLASIVGYVAIGMPLVLGFGGMALGSFRQSLSGFYYEPFLLGDIFVGCLVFIGTVLMAYKGWNRKVGQLATLAGISAYAVALFPAGGWVIGDSGERLYGTLANIAHGVGALCLFLILAWFCFAIFTKVEAHQRDSSGDLLPSKRRRNRIYRVTGFLLLAAIAAIAIGDLFFPEWSTRNRLTYWAETVALVAFGISWIVQGRASGLLMQDPRDRMDEMRAETLADTL